MQKFQNGAGKVGKMIETYLAERQQLRAVVSSGSAPCASQEDIQMYQFLKYYEIPVIVVATKATQDSSRKWNKHESVIKKRWNSIQQTPLFFHH